MRKKSCTELHSIFLSEFTQSLRKHSEYTELYLDRKNVNRGYYHENIIQSLLSNEICYRNRNDYSDISSVRPISWVIYHGHDQILKCIIDQIMKEKGNVCELFQNSYNKCPRRISNTNQNDKNLETGGSLYNCMTTKTDNESNLVMNNQIATFDSGKELNIGVYDEEVTYEQWRLL